MHKKELGILCKGPSMLFGIKQLSCMLVSTVLLSVPVSLKGIFITKARTTSANKSLFVCTPGFISLSICPPNNKNK